MRRKTRLTCVMLLLCAALPLLASGGDAGGAEHHGYDWEHFWQWLVNSLVFFGGLAYILRKPVADFFKNRRADIQEALKRAEQSREDAVRKLDDIERMSAELESEMAAITAQASADAAREKERLIKLAETEAVKIGEQARTEIENMRLQAVNELKVFLADLAVKDAEKVISGTMTDAERNKLFVDFTAKLGAKS